MSYRTVATWPPEWTWRAGKIKRHVGRREFGVLKEVIASIVAPENRIFLIIEHEDNEYMGCLLFDDTVFCSEVFVLLRQHVGDTLEHIGSVDLSRLL